MRMRIGDRVIVAKIKEREAAKQEFDAAKKDGKSVPFRARQVKCLFHELANIMPRIRLRLNSGTELLVPTDGVYEVVFPRSLARYPQNESTALRQDGFVKTPYLHQGNNLTSTLHISGESLRCSYSGSELYVAPATPLWQSSTERK